MSFKNNQTVVSSNSSADYSESENVLETEGTYVDPKSFDETNVVDFQDMVLQQKQPSTIMGSKVQQTTFTTHSDIRSELERTMKAITTAKRLDEHHQRLESDPIGMVSPLSAPSIRLLSNPSVKRIETEK